MPFSAIVLISALALAVTTFYILKKSLRLPESWRFLTKGREMLLERAKKNPYVAFSIAIPGKRLHVMSSAQHWSDMNTAHVSQLSGHAASKEMFQPKYTFGHEWSDRRDEDGMPVVRAIRTISRQFPNLHPGYLDILEDGFRKATKEAPQKNGCSRVPLFETVQRVMTRMNTLMILGEDAANDDAFITRGLRFIKQVSLILEGVRLIPSFLKPLLTFLVKGRDLDRKYIFSTMGRLTEQRRRQNRLTPTGQNEMPRNVLEAFVDNSPDEWSTDKIVSDINTLWVISTLAMPVVAAHLIQDLYLYKEHTSSLQVEARDVLNDPSADLDKLPLLENFLMESMRVNCFQSMTVHRIALQPFTFSDGHIVPPGDCVQFHQHQILSDEDTYPNSLAFDPARFQGKGRAATDIGRQWPFWGVPKLACPGRFHVSYAVKLMAIYVMQTYECGLEDASTLNFTWRDANVPNEKTVLLMRRK